MRVIPTYQKILGPEIKAIDLLQALLKMSVTETEPALLLYWFIPASFKTKLDTSPCSNAPQLNDFELECNETRVQAVTRLEEVSYIWLFPKLEKNMERTRRSGPWTESCTRIDPVVL